MTICIRLRDIRTVSSLASTLAFALMFSAADNLQAQLLSNLSSERGSNTLIQYAPDDPATRGRLFNLQTGHAGAFYNCDGEECKRNSPYIRWECGCEKNIHCTFWDVLQWRRDRSEIAQRICDGAGPCCNNGKCKSESVVSQKPATACSCAECVASNSGSAGSNVKEAVSEPAANTSAVVQKSKRGKTLLRVRSNSVGLIDDVAHRTRHETISVGATDGLAKTNAVAAEECDCYSCQVKRGEIEPVVSRPPLEPAAVSRSASLLDRARAGRKQR